MTLNHFEGSNGQERLYAQMRAVFAARGRGAGTQEFLLGWLYGLADAGALDADAVFMAQQFISHRQHEQAAERTVEMYAYPGDAWLRVEGKSLADLENEIMAGGPFPESRSERINVLARDDQHALHYLARHYVFLSRARSASMKFDD